MTSIAKQVWREIEDDVIIRRALAQGIVSMKNLAMHLIKTKNLHANADAVISAIRRYREEQPLERTFGTARKIIAESEDIKITTNIVEIALEKNKQTQDILQKILRHVDYDKGEILLVMQGEKTMKLLINRKNEEQIVKLFSQDAIVHVERDIAEINIQLSDDAVRTPGIVSVLTTELMLHNINVVEIMSCVPEMLFFVKQRDVVASYEILFEMCIGESSQQPI